MKTTLVVFYNGNNFIFRKIVKTWRRR